MIERIELKNFTAFTDLPLDFSPKINVIIGENGTGKTHLLKAAYALCDVPYFIEHKHPKGDYDLDGILTSKLLRLFMPMDDKIGKMHRQGATGQASLGASFGEPDGDELRATFSNNSKKLNVEAESKYGDFGKPVFIPTKEVLSLVKGMTDESHDHNTVELIFDNSYVDLANALMQSGHEDAEAKINLDPRFNTIVPQLVNLIGGRYEWENGGFCFQAGSYKEKASPNRTKAKAAQMYQDSTVTEFVATNGHLYSSGMTAEGFRKVGILHRLLSNGTLNPGTSGPLFWDEPESNMNPKLMKLLVQILLELSRNGQQIILATHDYVLLKWFDLLMDKGKGDHIAYHGLHMKDGDVSVETADDYKQLNVNAIANTFAELYDAEIDRSLGGRE